MPIQLSSSPVPQIPGKVHDTGDVVIRSSVYIYVYNGSDATRLFLRIQRVEATSMQARAKLASAEETIKMLQVNECVQVRAANECIQARADNAYNSLHVVPLTTGEGFASHNMQQEAVQYRRAVREQLRSAAAACKISALSVCALERVLCTPWQMLDGEVLSEDDEEEEVCRARRSRWGRFHIAWSHEA